MSESTPLPPGHRTHLGRALSEASQGGELVLQHCDHCHEIQYPPREVCKSCLSAELSWQQTDNQGVLLVANDLHNSLEPYYQQHLPWKLASVQLNAGPIVLAHNADSRTHGENVCVVAETDNQGHTLLVIAARDTEENIRKEHE